MPVKRPKGPKQFHVFIELDEFRRIKVVSAEEGRTALDLFRDIFMREVDRRYEAITSRGSRTKARQA